MNELQRHKAFMALMESRANLDSAKARQLSTREAERRMAQLYARTLWACGDCDADRAAAELARDTTRRMVYAGLILLAAHAVFVVVF